MSPYQSPDVKRYTAPDLERIGVEKFLLGVAAGILTLAVVLAFFDFVAR